MGELMPELEEGGSYTPFMMALPAYENFARGIMMKRRGGLTKTQMDVLVGLRYAGKMNMSQVADHAAVSKEQASRAVAPLVQRGLVSRSRSARQYRAVEVSLTDEGQKLLEDTRAEIDREIGERLSPLSQEDRDRLMEASLTAVEILRKLQPADH